MNKFRECLVQKLLLSLSSNQDAKYGA